MKIHEVINRHGLYTMLKTNKIMGQLIIQKIYTCDICGEIPEDGEKLWCMGNEIWCEKCCEEASSKIISIDDEQGYTVEQVQRDIQEYKKYVQEMKENKPYIPPETFKEMYGYEVIL